MAAAGNGEAMHGVPVAAYVESDAGPVIVANFGVLATREASRDEIDTLAEALLRIVPSVTVFSGRRYEFAAGAAEVAGPEVRISFQPHTLPDEGPERDATIARVVEQVVAWARAAAANPPTDGEDLAARFVRGGFDA